MGTSSRSILLYGPELVAGSKACTSGFLPIEWKPQSLSPVLLWCQGLAHLASAVQIPVCSINVRCSKIEEIQLSRFTWKQNKFEGLNNRLCALAANVLMFNHLTNDHARIPKGINGLVSWVMLLIGLAKHYPILVVSIFCQKQTYMPSVVNVISETEVHAIWWYF
jgi:hypothetical protein